MICTRVVVVRDGNVLEILKVELKDLLMDFTWDVSQVVWPELTGR